MAVGEQKSTFDSYSCQYQLRKNILILALRFLNLVMSNQTLGRDDFRAS